MKRFLETQRGSIYNGDSLTFMRQQMKDSSVDLIMTSPPFGLVRKKSYGNVDANEYVDWFKPFAEQFKRVLKDSGSLVIDIGGAWIPGQPTRSLYHFELLIMLCREFEFHLAQDFYWWNPAKLPTPAEWVNIRRVRVKDAINCVWWLSKTPWPKASNRRVLAPYSDSMKSLLKNGYKAKLRPSGHDISAKFLRNNGAAIPSNLIAIANTESNSAYARYCKQHGIPAHPARFPAELPEFFIRMTTDRKDLVFDPFAGSCMTGSVAEKLDRRWLCCELDKSYVTGALGRFVHHTPSVFEPGKVARDTHYKVFHPAALWNGISDPALPADGGKKRPQATKANNENGSPPSKSTVRTKKTNRPAVEVPTKVS